jgi:hypothetical protein
MFRIEKPTTIAAIAYLIMAIVILLPLNIGEYDPNYESGRKFDFGYRLLLLVILLIPIGLSLYSINCMVAGKCVIWSYINSVAICLWVILFLTASLIASERK